MPRNTLSSLTPQFTLQRRLLAFIALTMMVSLPAAVGAQNRDDKPPASRPRATVRLEVLLPPGADVTDAHAWGRALADAGIDARIRGLTEADDVELRDIGTPQRPAYLVLGLLTDDRKLALPNGTFSRTQTAAIKAWFEELATEGAARATERKLAFGLTATQLVQVHESLAAPVDFSTRDLPVRQAVESLSATLSIPVKLDAAAAAAMTDSLLCEDELRGVSAGTALAALVRPAGCVMVVRRGEAERLSLEIVPSDRAEEFWPVGWPIERPADVVAPQLKDKIKVDIKEFRLSRALAAIESKSGLTLLVDHNGAAASGIDLTETRVSYSHADAPYSAILNRLLSQSEPRMKYEIRVDEAERPFAWISPR